MSKIISNPTDSDIHIVVEGDKYSVEANGTKSVSDKVAEIWVKTHQFLTIGKDAKEEVKKVKKEEAKKDVKKVVKASKKTINKDK